MSNVVKASEYAAFCYFHVKHLKELLYERGHVYGYNKKLYNNWNDVVRDATKQFTSYYEDDTLIEQDVSLDKALRMAGLL